MKIKIFTLFPEMFSPLDASIIKRAKDDKKIAIEIIDIRDFSNDKHKKCDDYPFGGGAGMVMSVQPIYDAIQFHDPKHDYHRIFLSPKGKKLDFSVATYLSKKDKIILLCGHYEGVDQRAIDLLVDEEISIGDYVLTGGELAAMVLVDATCRHVDDVISSNSLSDETFNNKLLEYPQYTRPQDFLGQKVPDVLISGNHAEIERWRKEQSLELTKKHRPDLLN